MEEREYFGVDRIDVAEAAAAGSSELALAAVRALGSGPAALLARHGVIGVGTDGRVALEIERRAFARPESYAHDPKRVPAGQMRADHEATRIRGERARPRRQRRIEEEHHGSRNDTWASSTYADLVERAGPAGERHASTISISLDLKTTGRAIRAAGGGNRGPAGPGDPTRHQVGRRAAVVALPGLRLRQGRLRDGRGVAPATPPFSRSVRRADPLHAMAARAELLDHAVMPHEMERTDHDEVAVAVLQELLECVGPGRVTLGHELRVELGEVVEVAE